jgi:hypothetical protein
LICQLQPDVVLASAFRLNLLTTLLKPTLPRRTRLVIREVTVLDSLLGDGWRSRMLSILASRAFRNAHAIVCQTDTMRSDFVQHFRVQPDKLVTIFNPVNFAALHDSSAEFTQKASIGLSGFSLTCSSVDRKPACGSSGTVRNPARFAHLRMS